MGYCHYTERMFFDEKQLKFPQGGLKKGITRAQSTIFVDEKTFNLALTERKKHSGVLIAVPVPKSETGYFWIDDGVTLVLGEKKLRAKVCAGAGFNAEKDFTDFLSYRHVKCVYDEEQIKTTPLLLVSVLKY